MAIARWVLPVPRASDQDGVALMGDEVADARSRTSVSLIGVPVEYTKLVDVPGKRQLGMVIWYLIERACFSLISA